MAKRCPGAKLNGKCPNDVEPTFRFCKKCQREYVREHGKKADADRAVPRDPAIAKNERNVEAQHVEAEGWWSREMREWAEDE